jgi:hypothetical protein
MPFEVPRNGDNPPVNLRRLIKRRIRARGDTVDLVGDLNVVADVNVGGRDRVQSGKTEHPTGEAEPRGTQQKGAR